MELLKRVLRTEPLLLSNAIKAVGALLVVWGLPVTGVDIDNLSQLALSALATATFFVTFFDREQVFSQETHEAVVNEAVEHAEEEGAA